ncbi:GLIS2 [Acanthosepion pharaonis]|uniref:GLIS2 n=1 Tax=Acanthosepion pharaonis TaxID=158019 RepID=A0A812DJS3_ACAPH|nr:GLIS2 [Sepia pharaonis]
MYRCQWADCNQKFVFMDQLVGHVNEKHVCVGRSEVEYQCKWEGCPRDGKGFNARYKMLIHIRTHTNEKPHKCPLCGKCFSRLENLKIHNRSHTGEKPYSCPVPGCSKAYSNSSDRFKHVRTHQEKKPYVCKMPGCSKRYTDPSSLRKHVRTHGHYFRRENRHVGYHKPLSNVKPVRLQLHGLSKLQTLARLESSSVTPAESSWTGTSGHRSNDHRFDSLSSPSIFSVPMRHQANAVTNHKNKVTSPRTCNQIASTNLRYVNPYDTNPQEIPLDLSLTKVMGSS